MNYKLAKKLKDAGFPQTITGTQYYAAPINVITDNDDISNRIREWVYSPTLPELISACGDAQEGSGFLFFSHYLTDSKRRWYAEGRKVTEGRINKISSTGSSPEEAVAELWLSMQ